MCKTREEKKAKTKKAILEAAVHLFGKKGFDNTSIDQLAKEAGIGKGTIYTYFKTKSDILKAFCEDELDYVHRILATKTNPDSSFLEQIHTIFFAEFQYITRNKEFGRILMREILFPREGAIKCEDMGEDDYFAMLFPIIQRAKDRGELHEHLVPLYVAGHFYALFILLVSSWYSGRVETTEEVQSGMYELFEQTLVGLSPTKSQ